MNIDNVVDRMEKGASDVLEKIVPPFLIFIIGVIFGYAWAWKVFH